MCANVLRLASTASQVATLAENSWLDMATLGLLYDTSTGSGTAPSCLIMFSLSSGGSSAFGTRSTMVPSLNVCLFGMKTPPGPRMLQPPPPRIDRQRAQAQCLVCELQHMPPGCGDAARCLASSASVSRYFMVRIRPPAWLPLPGCRCVARCREARVAFELSTRHVGEEAVLPRCQKGGSSSRRHVLLEPGHEPGQVISDGRESADAVSFPGVDHQF
jgi:hypothetical protein